MGSLFRGGPEGQRRAALVLALVIAPVGTVELALMGRLSAPAFAFRVPLLAAIVGYLYSRKRPTAAEWFVVIAVLPALVMVQTQWIAGLTYTLLFVVNAVVLVAFVSILFPTWLVAASAVAYVTATLVAQLHLRDTESALAISAAVALACLLVVVFVHGAASYLRHTVAEVEALSADREVVYRRVQAAADRERVRIAGELHDDAVQALVAGTYQLDGAAARLAESDPDGRVRGMVVAARDTISGAIERIRHLSFDLYPPQLEKDGLEPALGSLAHDAERQYAVKVIVSASPGRVDHAAERLAYRTIKELCTNALKHANARTIRLSAEHDQFAIRGLVEDDGRGYDPAEHQSRRQAGHIGLDATAERVRLADGEFTLVSPPGGGTRASFTIPLVRRGQSVAGG